MSSGWYGESYRHKLASKGVRTARYMKRKSPRYFQQKADFKVDPDIEYDSLEQSREDIVKRSIESAREGFASEEAAGLISSQSPRTAEGNILAERRLKEKLVEDVKEKRPVNQILTLIERGQPSNAIELLRDDEEGETARLSQLGSRELSKADENALRTALKLYALQQAQAGLPVSREVLEQIDNAAVRQVEDIAKARVQQEKELKKSDFRKALEGAVPGALAEALDTSTAASFVSLNQPKPEEGDGIVGKIGERGGNPDDLADSPFLTQNAFLTSNEIPSLNPIKGEVPKLNASWDFVGDGPATNPVLASSRDIPKTQFESVKQRVDELYDSRRDLAEVDLSPYEKGNEAFEKGNREELLAAIIDLKGEEAVLKDRFNMIGQIRAQLSSPETVRSAFSEKSGNAFLNLLRNGGGHLAEETDKINRVRSDVVTAANETFSRRKMLEYRLQRLDAVVPPETDVPEKVQRFSKRDMTTLNPLLGQKNPLLGKNPVLDKEMELNNGV